MEGKLCVPPCWVAPQSRNMSAAEDLVSDEPQGTGILKQGWHEGVSRGACPSFSLPQTLSLMGGPG